MNSSRTGLALHPATPEFLKRAYDVSFVRDEAGMPLYRDKRGKYFWGGWGSFYTVCLEDDTEVVLKEAQALGKEYGLVEGCFSLPQDIFHARHGNVLLTIPDGMRSQERLDLYERNIKKHVRNTVAHSSVRYTLGSVPPDWYALHCQWAKEHGHMPHAETWFEALRESFAEDLLMVLARDGERLVGGLVCIRSGMYLHLLSIADDATYRQARVDSGLYDRAILFAIEGGIRYVDFGLTGVNVTSLLSYKKGFGGVPWYLVTSTFGSPMQRALDIASRASRRILGR